MTKEAQNCLLKTLEEPPEYVTIILITSNESLILNTVKSRCTKVNFNPIDDNLLSKYLKENYGIEDINQTMLKSYSGSIKKALEMHKNKDIYEELNKYFGNISNYKIIDTLNKIECLYKNKEIIQEMLEYINTILFEQGKKDTKYLKYIEYIEEAKQKIKLNANYDMTIDNLLLQIFE
jgi:DNA polymerase-3 subunit delta'